MSETKSPGQLFNDKAREELYKRIAEDKKKGNKKKTNETTHIIQIQMLKNWVTPVGKVGTREDRLKGDAGGRLKGVAEL